MASRMTLTSFHQPPLDSGDYTITVNQTVTATEIDPKDPAFSASLNFSVRGPRFSLDPQVIAEVFPPEGSQGDHSNVLPHVILTRSTLPWERTPQEDAKNPATPVAPWLALLLFTEDESEQVEICTVSLNELRGQIGACFPSGGTWPKTTDACAGPYLKPESGDNDEDRVTVIQLSQALYQKNIIPPTLKQLSLLVHVRSTTDAAGEVAVIIGSRLPMAGGISSVHLVSVEGRYDSTGNFDYPKNDKVIRLVSLKSWRFACSPGGLGFKELLGKLTLDTLQLPPLPAGVGGFDQIANDANDYLGMGSVPLPHAMRQGNRSVSWYHGPFVPGLITITSAARLPVHAADALVLYNQTYGMFDVSYAAAWQLGRLLALQSKSFSSSLYRWKRRHTAILNNAKKVAKNPPPASHTPAPTDLPFPPDVISWLRRLGLLLEGVPLRYLVPDERMLPPESIRFFQVDNYWIKCLIDGAFSIGRALDSDSEYDAETWLQHLNPQGEQGVLPYQASGFLMRSEVVAGWPGLIVDGYNKLIEKGDSPPIPLYIQVERLTKNVLLCLFNRLVQTVDIHLKPESLHFGLDGNRDGVSINNDRILKLDTVLTDAATFAAQMIAGAEGVRFSASSGDNARSDLVE